MSTYQILIDDNAIKEQIVNIINIIFQSELDHRYSDTSDVIACAVKEIIYSRKDEIIDKVVDRATKEIVRKGLPKLLKMVTDKE